MWDTPSGRPLGGWAQELGVKGQLGVSSGQGRGAAREGECWGGGPKEWEGSEGGQV